MGNASGHQCKVKISDGEKKVNKNTHDISSIKRVTKSFWKFLVVVVQNNGKEMYKKGVLHVQRCFFANKNYCCFSLFSSLLSIARLGQCKVQTADYCF